MVGRQPSRAATPGAELLAAPGHGLPGASSRQVSGVAEELDRTWSGVLRKVEGTSQQVRSHTSSGTSVTLSTPHRWRAPHLVLRHSSSS